MYNMSAAMGPRFAEVAREMTEKIRKLGPSPIKKYAKGMEQGAGGKAEIRKDAPVAAEKNVPAKSAEPKEATPKDKMQGAAPQEKSLGAKGP
jgi:flagellar motor protein MotB